MSGSPSRGRFVWYDLMTPDPEGAMAFYTKVAGWSLSDWETAEDAGSGPNKMWTAGEKPIGGVMSLPPEAAAQGAPPHWMAYVTVPDTQAVVEKTLEMGGKVLLPPKTMAGVGTFAVLQDPQGAAFAPYTPEADDPAYGGPPSVGEFSWHELATTDHEAAFRFYASIFGWEVSEDMDMGELGIYRIYGPGGEGSFPYGGMFTKPQDMPAPPHWLHYIRVPDVHAAVERVQELGGQVLHGPMEVPGGDFIAQCMDPQGAMFALHHFGVAAES